MSNNPDSSTVVHLPSQPACRTCFDGIAGPELASVDYTADQPGFEILISTEVQPCEQHDHQH